MSDIVAAREEAAASSSRLQALAWLVSQQRELAAELQARLSAAAPLADHAVEQGMPPIEMSAKDHLECAHTALTLAIVALGAPSSAESSGERAFVERGSDLHGDISTAVDVAGQDGGGAYCQQIQELRSCCAAAMHACSSIAQYVPLVEAAAGRRIHERRQTTEATSQRLAKLETQLLALTEENRMLTSTVK